MTIVEQARELLALWDGRAEVAGVHLSFHAIATPVNVAARCRALIARDEALRNVIDAFYDRSSEYADIADAIVAVEVALTDDGLPREG